ncbi:hypothetical protein EDD16DRAFT_1728587 [Pisolithus croceorrhizus]|nr:hypothetical protein EDD16DRAFT_1728587 [Pisolithus croceorrhizus]KAI6135675.1 hypothetical protein EV401DRAFT_2191808 [Pisolithus croceorrhizus]
MKDQQSETLPPILNPMSDSATYQSTPNAYNSTTHYLPAPLTGNVYTGGLPSRTEPQRKRPKYTRSKTGCLTCRVKKIKCDETKPICMRCTHGQRDCTWPEGVPTRKKPVPKKESVDGRPSTAESSGISETSTPPTRDNTPPQYTRPPAVSRRHSEPLVLPIVTDPEAARRQFTSHGYPPLHHPSQSSSLSIIPEMSTYQPSQPRYDTTYSGTTTTIHAHQPRVGGPSHAPGYPLHVRTPTQHQLPQHHWAQPQPQMLPGLSLMDPFTLQYILEHYYGLSAEDLFVNANLPLAFR